MESIPCCLRCKKISYALKKEDVTLQDIRLICEEEPIRKIINKSYNSIPHLSGSRVGEKDSHLDPRQEAFLTTAFPPIDCLLYLEEKMDGSNVAVIRKNNELIGIGRSGYKCETSDQEQHRKFAQWVKENEEKFNSLLPEENMRVVGEWMALAHGTLYEDLPSPFMAFDLFNGKEYLNSKTRRELFNSVGIECVPLLTISTLPITINKALKRAMAQRKICEGVVYRLERYDKNKEDYVPWIIAKVVRKDKEDGIYLDNENPTWLWY